MLLITFIMYTYMITGTSLRSSGQALRSGTHPKYIF